MGKMAHHNKDNLVLFPDLGRRLLARAMALVNKKHYREARVLFGKLIELNDADLQGLYGWAVCSVELGDYREAEQATHRLLLSDTPHYYEVFHLYLTILIEKKDYRGALREIYRMRGRKNVPAEVAEFLGQMQKFCEMRMRETGAGSPGAAEREVRYDRETAVDWPALERADPQRQMLLIHNMAGRLGMAQLPEIRRFLMDDQQRPEIKTMLLCVVHENRLANAIDVRKFGTSYHVVFDDRFLNKAFADRLAERIRDVLNSENPTLAELATQNARFFTLAVSPKALKPPSTRVWAAVFSIQAARAGKLDIEPGTLLDLFHVTPTEYRQADRLVRAVGIDGIG